MISPEAFHTHVVPCYVVRHGTAWNDTTRHGTAPHRTAPPISSRHAIEAQVADGSTVTDVVRNFVRANVMRALCHNSLVPLNLPECCRGPERECDFHFRDCKRICGPFSVSVQQRPTTEFKARSLVSLCGQECIQVTQGDRREHDAPTAVLPYVCRFAAVVPANRSALILCMYSIFEWLDSLSLFPCANDNRNRP